MKLSELKQIIREVIEEKTEYGPDYKQSVRDLKAGKMVKKVSPKKSTPTSKVRPKHKPKKPSTYWTEK